MLDQVDKEQWPSIANGAIGDFRLATLGNVDSGKSTLTGCLTRGILDDGKGRARMFILRHAHEKKRGQTSSIATSLIGYNSVGEQVLPNSTKLMEKDANSGSAAQTKNTSHDTFSVANRSAFHVSIIDLCGHEKYLKTSIYGLTAQKPDLALVVVGAERGVQRMTREHVGLTCALSIPFFLVLTKIDLAPPDVLSDSRKKVKQLLKCAGRKPFLVRKMEDIHNAVDYVLKKGNENIVIPVFEVSCVSGKSIPLLRQFLKETTRLWLNANDSKFRLRCCPQSIPKDEKHAVASDEEKKKPDADISTSISAKQRAGKGCTIIVLNDVFTPPGIGLVVGGYVYSGECHVGSNLYLGPTKTGQWFGVVVRSIHRQYVPSTSVHAGQEGSFAIKSTSAKVPVKREHFRRGMIAVGEGFLAAAKRQTVLQFSADIRVLHHATTIRPSYSPFVHTRNVRQCARILSIKDLNGEEVVARTGSRVRMRFAFMSTPEYLEIGERLIFREGTSKGCGTIVELHQNASMLETVEKTG